MHKWTLALGPDNVLIPDVADIVADGRAGRRRGLQAQLTSAALRTMITATLDEVLWPQVNRLLKNLCVVPPPPPLEFRKAVMTLVWCPLALASAAIRSWTSAWSTLARQQHEPGACPFGWAPPLVGDGHHLMQCPTLWAAAASAIDVAVLPIMERLGIVTTPRVQRARSQGPPIGVLMNATAVEIYHRRPRHPAENVEDARLLASSLAKDARHLAPLRLRLRAAQPAHPP